MNKIATKQLNLQKILGMLDEIPRLTIIPDSDTNILLRNFCVCAYAHVPVPWYLKVKEPTLGNNSASTMCVPGIKLK